MPAWMSRAAGRMRGCWQVAAAYGTNGKIDGVGVTPAEAADYGTLSKCAGGIHGRGCDLAGLTVDSCI